MAIQAPLAFPAEDMPDLLAEIVTGVAGESKAAWLKRIGGVVPLPTWRFVTHNWRIDPTGSAAQREIIARAVEIVRAEHPYVA